MVEECLKTDLCRARCILWRSVTGGRWPEIGDDNGDNQDNLAGTIGSDADIWIEKAGIGAQQVGYKYRIRTV